MSLSTGTVRDDLTKFRAQLRQSGEPYQRLLELNPLRPTIDIAVDWLVIALAVLLCVDGSWVMLPLALAVIGNRQRSLGNILHDGAHRNLSRRRAVNDTLVRLCVAPAMFASLSVYRDEHNRHHMALGHPAADPDYLQPDDDCSRNGLCAYLHNLLSFVNWKSSTIGHLGRPGLAWQRRLPILVWWAAVSLLVDLAFGDEPCEAFAALWLLARATSYHMITTFREMCDHYGLAPGGVCSFTRDVVTRGLWRCLVHPRNDGLHLTHHLLPTVPYYRLPQAQQVFARVPMYRGVDRIQRSYLLGQRSVVATWTPPVQA